MRTTSLTRKLVESSADRRRMLGWLSAGAVAVLFASFREAIAEGAPATLFRSVAVDARPLAAIGGGASAGLIERILPGKLNAVFAARLAPREPRAPTLLARIDTLHLSAYADAPSMGIDTLGTMDTMVGEGIVLAGRQTVSITPLRVTLPAGYSGASYLPDIDQRRVDSLCFAFASWLGREMNI